MKVYASHLQVRGPVSKAQTQERQAPIGQAPKVETLEISEPELQAPKIPAPKVPPPKVPAPGVPPAPQVPARNPYVEYRPGYVGYLPAVDREAPYAEITE